MIDDINKKNKEWKKDSLHRKPKKKTNRSCKKAYCSNVYRQASKDQVAFELLL